MRPIAARVFLVAASTDSGSLTSMRSTCAAGWSTSGATSHATTRRTVAKAEVANQDGELVAVADHLLQWVRNE